jgi:signal transduction histidine kinase
MVAVAGLILPAEVIALVLSDRWVHLWFRHDPVVNSVQLLSTAAAVVGGALLVVRRPSNRCGQVALALGAVFAGWYVTSVYWGSGGGWPEFVPVVFVYLLRPLLFWLVLAFPVGRLDRAGWRVLVAITAGSLFAFLLGAFVQFGSHPWPHQPLMLWRDATWARLANSAWWDVGAFLAAAAVLVAVRRRTLRFHGSGARVAAPAWWAALIAAGADLVLIGSGPLRDILNHNGYPTFSGSAVALVDYARWGAVIAVLAIGARRAWPRERSGGRSVELGLSGSAAPLGARLRRLLGDPTAEVLIADRDRGWVDRNGAPQAAAGDGRALTVLTHNGEALAALELDESLAAHPAIVDAAVTAMALELESARQVAIAAAREAELRHLARQVLEAEDDALRRLEHDLHDGAQQVLVGATLQATLAARADGHGATSSAAVAEVSEAITTARAALLAAATGRPPALLAERGLHGALGALAVTAPLPVRVDVDACDDLPEALQRAIWFSAAEAVTNALKHAGASVLELRLRRGAEVLLVVGDDGRGGVTQPPAALAWRVEDAAGHLHVDSTCRGTTVTARFPLAVGAGR